MEEMAVHDETQTACSFWSASIAMLKDTYVQRHQIDPSATVTELSCKSKLAHARAHMHAHTEKNLIPPAPASRLGDKMEWRRQD